MKRSAARTTGMLAVSILVAVFAGAPVAFADPPVSEPQVTLCHRTGAVANPYIEHSVDQSSIMKLAQGNKEAGHGWHQGPVFTTSMTNVDDWGDIIPPFPGFDGLNVAAGQAWLDGHCDSPQELKLVKLVVGSDEPASSWTLDATGGPTAFAAGTSGVSHGVAAGNYNLTESANLAGYSSPGWACSNAPGEFVQSVTIGTTDVTCTITNTLGTTPTEVSVAKLTLTPGTCDQVGSFDATPTDDYTWGFIGEDNARFYTAIPIGEVTLVDNDPQGPFDLSKLGLNLDLCTTTPTEVSVAKLTLTPGTCDQVGSFDATPTDDYTWGFIGEDNARFYTAIPIGEVTLVDNDPQGPFDLSKIPFQSTNPNGDCYVDPVVPVVPTVPTVPTVQPRITLKAAVVNEAGGTAQVSDFTLTGSSIEVTHEGAMQNSAAMAASAATTSFSGVTGDAAITNAVVPAGTYSLSESALPSGYSASAWACTGGQLNGSVITVTFGNTVECVITNTYSSTVVDSPGVPTAHPASPPAAVLGVEKTAPRATTPAATTPTVTTLAFTGAEPVPLTLLALLALVLGVALTVAGRRQGGQRARG